MPNDYFKYDEIQEHFYDAIKDNGKEWVERYYDDLHYYVYTQCQYRIGNYQCEQWLGAKAFYAIRIIKEYEEIHFGEITTDLSDSEMVVNSYASIVGEQIVNEWKITQEEETAQ